MSSLQKTSKTSMNHPTNTCQYTPDKMSQPQYVTQQHIHTAKPINSTAKMSLYRPLGDVALSDQPNVRLKLQGAHNSWIYRTSGPKMSTQKAPVTSSNGGNRDSFRRSAPPGHPHNSNRLYPSFWCPLNSTADQSTFPATDTSGTMGRAHFSR